MFHFQWAPKIYMLEPLYISAWSPLLDKKINWISSNVVDLTFLKILNMASFTNSMDFVNHLQFFLRSVHVECAKCMHYYK